MRRVALLMLGMLLPLGLQAEPPGYYQQSPSYMPQDGSDLARPAMVLRRGIETLTGYLDNNRGIAPQQLRQFLEQEIVPYFDFRRMAYWAAGPLNRYFTAPQRERFVLLLKERFIGAMLEQLTGYQHTQLQYLRPRGNPLAGDITLGVRVFSANSYPVQIDFRLYRGEQGWKVYDVVANGNSAVSHYRREFGMLARQYGVAGLLGRLER